MKTLDQLDHEEARQALALFSQMEAAAKGRDIDAILAASTNMVAETILRGCDFRKEAERIADDVAAKLSETVARYWSPVSTKASNRPHKFGRGAANLTVQPPCGLPLYDFRLES